MRAVASRPPVPLPAAPSPPAVIWLQDAPLLPLPECNNTGVSHPRPCTRLKVSNPRTAVVCRSWSNPTTPERARAQAREADHEERQQISPDARRIPQPQFNAPIAGPSNAPALTNQQIAQRARQQQERERRQQGEERPAGGAPPVPIQPPPPASVPANPPVLNARQIAQRARRAREQAERQAQAAAIIEGVPQIPQPQGEQQAGEGANPIFQQNNAGEQNEDEGEEQMPVLELEEPMGARAEAREARRAVVQNLTARGRQNIGGMNVVCQHCGAYHWEEEKLSKSRANNPLFGSCCREGRIQIPLTKTTTP
ncbi:ATP-dependent DNA helicase PIF1 [Ceratobasidium sp. AG-Ba]|nr:ATP-dependent DNA helicase PIF1 [Ceratobasidium sp. AG-Ba]